jgi:hypothetical protein
MTLDKMNSPDSAAPLFAPYEKAVDDFLRAGGHTATVIHSPRALFKQYRAEFGDLPYAGGANVTESAQNYVSVRGTTVAGHDFEWPEQE